MMTHAYASLLLLSSIPRVVLGQEASPYTKVVAFGDSMLDGGAKYRRTRYLFNPSPPYALGRSSNGRTFIEDAAVMANIPLLNYAESGATACTSFQSGLSSFVGDEHPAISVQAQTARYLKTATPAEISSPTTLHVFQGSDNDEAYVALLVVYGVIDISAVAKPLQKAVKCLLQAVTDVLAAGAVDVVVLTPLDQSITPVAKVQGPEAVQGFAYLYSIREPSFESQLAALKSSQPSLANGTASLRVFDFGGILKSTSDPSSPDFFKWITEVDVPCYDQATEVECDNQMAHYWWDEPHPTKKVHKAIGKMFYGDFLEVA